MDRRRLEREVHRMVPRVLRSGMKYDEAALSRVSTLIQESTLDYANIIASVESIIV